MKEQEKKRVAQLVRPTDGVEVTRRGELQIELAKAAGFVEVAKPVITLKEEPVVAKEPASVAEEPKKPTKRKAKTK